MQLLGYSGWLVGCCYAVTRVPGVVGRVLKRYSGWLVGCCYAVARVPEAVDKVLLCGC